jgi:hypothetical protein
LEKTTKIHDLQLTGKFKTFEQFDIAKARQKKSTNIGRVEVKPLESDNTWILVPLRTSAMEDSRFGP